MHCVVFVAHTFISVTTEGRGSQSLRADTAVRPYAEDFQQKALVLGKLQYQSPNLYRGGLPRPPGQSILKCPGTKKRRMLCIVVPRLPAVFYRLMLLDYQIGLNFASGVGL